MSRAKQFLEKRFQKTDENVGKQLGEVRQLIGKAESIVDKLRLVKDGSIDSKDLSELASLLDQAGTWTSKMLKGK